MPDPSRLLTTIRRCAVFFSSTPGRQGRLVELQDVDEVFVAGDMHGNVENFKQFLLKADPGRHPRRHLVFQELVHGPFRYPQGGDKSHQLLDLMAASKCRYPEQIHMLLGNHELAQWTRESIMKSESNLIELFAGGVQEAYGDHAEEILSSYDTLFASLPVGLRTPNRVFLSHSLPSSRRRSEFSFEKLAMDDLPAEDYYLGGTLYALVWGRDTSQDNIDWFLQTVDADWLVSGHIPCDDGYAVPNARQLILDSQGNPACCCHFSTTEPMTLERLIAGVEQL